MEYIYPKLTSFEQQNLKMEISKTNIPLYIKTRNIRIYVPYSQPNDWTEWAEIFETSAGCKDIEIRILD